MQFYSPRTLDKQLSKARFTAVLIADCGELQLFVELKGASPDMNG